MSTKEVNDASFYEIQTHINTYYDKVFAYAKLLRQPLTLGMFIPVDENGKPYDMLEVEVWKNHSQYSTHYREELEFFEQAKERVLFEGFEVGYNGLDIISAWREEITLVFNKKTCICEEYKTIEEFANSNKKPKLIKNPIT